MITRNSYWKNLIQGIRIWRKIKDLERAGYRKTQQRNQKNQKDARVQRKNRVIYFITFEFISFCYLSGIFCFVHFFRWSYGWVTSHWEGGTVRGSP